MITIDIRHNLPIIKDILTQVSQVAVKKAAVQSMNRAAQTVRAEGSRWIAKRIALPISGSRSERGGGRTPPGIRSMIEISRAKFQRSASLSQMYATVHMSNKPISLIHFIRGSKDPRPQKGIKIKDRKVLTAMVKRGGSIKLPKAFIAKSSRGGAVQVFYRKGQGSYHKQSVPSLYVWAQKPEFQREMRAIALKRLIVEYPRQLAYYTNQIKVSQRKP